MTVSRLCFEGNHEWCMNRSIAESRCTCSCHGARPPSSETHLRGRVEKLTVENNGLREFVEVAQVKMTRAEKQSADTIATLKSRLISGFYEEELPQFSQGEPTHELQELVTAEEVSGYVQRIAALREALRIYGGHIPPCRGRPCTCGFQDTWRAAGLPESK